MVLALVLGLHLLFLLVAGQGRPPPSPAPEPEAMILLYLPPAVEVPKTQQRPKSRPALRANTPPAPQTPPTQEPSAAITPEPAQPAIDWNLQAHITAEAQAQAGAARITQECEEARQHGKFPPGCPKDSYDPHWAPQEKKAGFIGIAPYFRLGKRCIVVPPFFACNLDAELPAVNGALLKDMSDPSQPASSVPDFNNAAPEAPKPQAVKPQ